MELQELQRHWDGFGLTDPLWAILTDPSKRGGNWDVHEFFALGEQEISGVMDMIGALGIEVHPDRALDFGCGVGRLTQALAPRFKSVCGVDIAPSMIEHARRFNRFEQCSYLVNVRADLHAFRPTTSISSIQTLCSSIWSLGAVKRISQTSCAF